MSRATSPTCGLFFFLSHTATTEIYTLSLHDALPISHAPLPRPHPEDRPACGRDHRLGAGEARLDGEAGPRSEEHTSELQSRQYLVCRLLLEKKKNDTEEPKRERYRPVTARCHHQISF